jgi:hypothetical protein
VSQPANAAAAGKERPVHPPKPKESLSLMLKRGDAQLSDLIDEDVRAEFLREFRVKNPKLIQVLAKRENLTQLLESLVTEEPISMFVYEILTADVPLIQGR